MNKRVLKMVDNYNNGKIKVRRDQLQKAVEENAFDYMIVRGYDEVYNVEPFKAEANIENIPEYWFRNASIWCKVEDNILKVTMSYGYSYKDLYVSLEEKKEAVNEVATAENTSSVEGVEVVYNDDKNGIEITFESKELATEEIRTELKKVGFRYFFKLNKWIARQNDETITTVNKLFGSASEIEEIDVTEEVEEMLQEETAINVLDNMEVVEDLTAVIEDIEPKENNKLKLHIEGEGSVEELTTNNIKKATENLNKRILNEYNETCGGYSKTFVTLTYKDNTYKFRYDIDNRMNLQSNILAFMLDEEYKEYKYTLDNIEKFTWIKEENYKKEMDQVIRLLGDLLDDNGEEIEIVNNPYSEAIEKIVDSQLYNISASHDWIIKDSRLIRNDYFNAIVLTTGKAIKEFINEGRRIDVFNLKPYMDNIEAFKEGLEKVDNGNLVTLFPTNDDIEIRNVKMLPRLEKELKRVS